MPTDLLQYLSAGSPIVLAAVIVALMMGWLVPGPIYRDIVARCKQYEERVEKLTDSTYAFSSVIHEAVDELKAQAGVQAREEERSRWLDQPPPGQSQGAGSQRDRDRDRPPGTGRRPR